MKRNDNEDNDNRNDDNNDKDGIHLNKEIQLKPGESKHKQQSRIVTKNIIDEICER